MGPLSKIAAAMRASGTEDTSGRPRLLITDDRPEIVSMVVKGLGSRYDCEFTSSVAQAREKLATGTFRPGPL